MVKNLNKLRSLCTSVARSNSDRDYKQNIIRKSRNLKMNTKLILLCHFVLFVCLQIMDSQKDLEKRILLF